MFGKKPLELSPSSLADSSWGVPGLSSIEAKIYACCIAFLVAIRWSSKFASREGVRTLDVGALNRVVASKEIMWAYLNAGVLEPLLTIAGSEDITEKQLIVNCLQLAGLMFWIYLIFDAFDTSDVQQAFVYRKLKKSAADTQPWLTIQSLKHKRAGVMSDLSGTMQRDLALWFVLSGIFAAWAGVVSHREVIHSYVVVGLWIILHHQSRRATAWGAGYFHTLFSPSATLMPMEYCLLLTDADSIEDLDTLSEWRNFIAEESGISLDIRA